MSKNNNKDLFDTIDDYFSQINGEEIPVAQEAEEIPHMYQQLIQKMMEGGHA